ncbi:unnamed protein product, partial [marine sediment metagenome]
MLHQDLFSFVKAGDTSVAGKVFYLVLPGSIEYPAAVIAQVGREAEHHITGPTGVATSIFRIT